MSNKKSPQPLLGLRRYNVFRYLVNYPPLPSYNVRPVSASPLFFNHKCHNMDFIKIKCQKRVNKGVKYRKLQHKKRLIEPLIGV